MQNVFKKKLVFVILFFNFQINSSYLKDLLSPYSELDELLPFNNHGWYSNAEWIEKLMIHNKVTTVIEVGSWLGLSTRHIASLLQPNGKLYAVDTWQGSADHYQNPEWIAMLPKLYQQFLSNMIHAKLTNTVIPIKMTSLQASEFLKDTLNKVDLVYIDAAHDTYSVLHDLDAYWSYVKYNKGILCGDDWWWDSVKVAVRIFAEFYKLTIYASDNFWFLKKEQGYLEKDFKSEDIAIWKFEKSQ